jgi:hypothetical protein
MRFAHKDTCHNPVRTLLSPPSLMRRVKPHWQSAGAPGHVFAWHAENCHPKNPSPNAKRLVDGGCLIGYTNSSAQTNKPTAAFQQRQVCLGFDVHKTTGFIK